MLTISGSCNRRDGGREESTSPVCQAYPMLEVAGNAGAGLCVNILIYKYKIIGEISNIPDPQHWFYLYFLSTVSLAILSISLVSIAVF
jgi:hypothetical protein